LLAQAGFQPPQLADYMRILPELVLSIFGMFSDGRRPAAR
jgi:hypothetical protein